MSLGVLTVAEVQKTPLKGDSSPHHDASVPIYRDALAGMRDTMLLVRARWRAVRNPAARWGILAGSLFLLMGLFLAANTAFLVRGLAQQGIDSTGGTFAITWIISLQRGELGDVGAITIGGALIAAIFAPFTGSSTLSLTPVEDLQGVRLARSHRYFDSFLINCISGIGLLQLLALTGIASVLTLAGDKGPAMLLTWLIWVLVVALTTTIGWTLEWVLRKWGRGIRRLLGALGVVAIISLVASDTESARSLFGIGTPYATLIRGAAQGESTLILLASAGIIVGILILLVFGLAVTRKALAYPAPVPNIAKNRRAGKMPLNPTALMTKLLFLTLWRTPECRRPVLGILGLGLPALLFIPLTENLETAIMLAVPLAVSLAWGVNVFGVLGSGMTWLSAQPRTIGQAPRVAAAMQFVLTVLLIILLYLASYLSGNAPEGAGQRLLVGSIIAGSLSAAVSINLSVRHPMRARLSGRGDSLVSPVTALNYLLRLVFLACAPAFLVMATGTTLQLFYTITFLVLALAGVAWADIAWHKPKVRARVVAEVSAQ